jgi:type VI protein secretion system component VasK
MELSIDPETAETIAWGAWGALSFIALIAWCRWRGTPEDRKESKASQDAEKKRTPLDAIEHELNKGDR